VANLEQILMSVRLRIVPRGESQRPVRRLSRMLVPKALTAVTGLSVFSVRASCLVSRQPALPLISS